jgi:glycerol-3-phosphate dehydrogenase (NAD(P)+)
VKARFLSARKNNLSMNISVLGAGAWGTTLAILLSENGHNVTLWEYNARYAKLIEEKHENITFLPGIPLPSDLHISNDLEESTVNKEIIVTAIPTQFTRQALGNVSFSNIRNTIFVSVSKGIEKSHLLTVSQIYKDVFPELSVHQIGVLSGPSHAEEVSKRIPTTVVAACKDHDSSKTIQSAFINRYFRVYSSTDVIGVELGGAFKNVIAIGAGILDGMGMGDNTKAAIMTRGTAEITRLGLAMGAKQPTFSGLSGMGDLIVTCMSRHSRNRYVGEEIGKGKKLKEVLAGMTAIAEGVATSNSAMQLAIKHNVEVPITSEVYKVLFEDKDPATAIHDLMTRDRKEEYKV